MSRVGDITANPSKSKNYIKINMQMEAGAGKQLHYTINIFFEFLFFSNSIFSVFNLLVCLW